MYYSGQFINLFEIQEQSWREQLQKEAERNVLPFTKKDGSEIPGYISIVNLLYNFVEFFEFAARLCSKNLYKEEFQISVELFKIKNFALIAEYPKFWHGYYPATSDSILKSWKVSPERILTESSELALEGSVYFFSRFGWDNPPLDILKQDQEKFLSSRTY